MDDEVPNIGTEHLATASVDDEQRVPDLSFHDDILLQNATWHATVLM
jgi:hypothetical protein